MALFHTHRTDRRPVPREAGVPLDRRPIDDGRADDDVLARNGASEATGPVNATGATSAMDASGATVPQRAYTAQAVQESRRISIGNPLQFIVPLVGLALVALGIATMIRGGFGGGFDQRSATILGFDQTPWLAIAEVAGGLVLFFLSWSRLGRMVAALMGAGLVAVGVMVLLGTPSVRSNIGTNDAGGWLAIVLGALTVLGCATPCALVERRRVASEPAV